MGEAKTYSDEIFEWRVNRYKQKKRTKHPVDEMRETALRVNRLLYKKNLPLCFPDDLTALSDGSASDGRLPINLYDLRFNFNSTTKAITVAGTGGSMVLDDRVCMVDFSRQFMEYIQQESCGECTFCRIGSRRIYEILTGICTGRGGLDDIDRLETLAEKMNITSLCEVGKIASNPVLCSVKNLRQDYEDHILHHKCRAGICSFA